MKPALTDSFQDDLLAPPVYTRPAKFNEWEVPEILTWKPKKQLRSGEEKL